MIFQKLSHLQRILIVARHSKVKRFQADIGQESILGRLTGSHIPHQLYSSFGDISLFPETLGINDAMIGLVRRGQTRIFVLVAIPVKIAAVHDTAAQRHGMSVHIFCGGVRYNVRSEFKGTAVNGRGKGIVTDQGYTCSWAKAANFSYPK